MVGFCLSGLGVGFFNTHVNTGQQTGASDVFQFKGSCGFFGLAGSLAPKLSAEWLCGKRQHRVI